MNIIELNFGWYAGSRDSVPQFSDISISYIGWRINHNLLLFMKALIKYKINY